MMKYKIHPLWWPLFTLAAPLILPYLYYKNESYKLCIENIGRINRERIKKTEPLKLNETKNLTLTAIVDAKQETNFKSEAGISYFLETDTSKLLFDTAFAGESEVFENNFEKLNLDNKKFKKLLISHLHPDHMGGIKASRKNEVDLSPALKNKISDIYLPGPAEIDQGNKIITYAPQLIESDIATTGPLRANLFFSGPTEEQSLVINIKNKGAVVILGCGHPDLKTTLKMAEKISDRKIYAVAGGLHLPVKNGRLKKAGIDLQRLIGTGLKPWQKLDDNYLKERISVLEEFGVEKILLSPHDSSDYALKYFQDKLTANIKVVRSGKNYEF